MKLNPEKDIEIDVTNLSREIRNMGPLIYRYSKEKAEIQEDLETAEAKLKELRSTLLLNLSKDTDMKETTKKAAIDIHLDVIALGADVRELKRDLETYKGFIDGLKAKKDMLIQLGSDRRKDK